MASPSGPSPVMKRIHAAFASAITMVGKPFSTSSRTCRLAGTREQSTGKNKVATFGKTRINSPIGHVQPLAGFATHAGKTLRLNLALQSKSQNTQKQTERDRIRLLLELQRIDGVDTTVVKAT